MSKCEMFRVHFLWCCHCQATEALLQQLDGIISVAAANNMRRLYCFAMYFQVGGAGFYLDIYTTSLK